MLWYSLLFSKPHNSNCLVLNTTTRVQYDDVVSIACSFNSFWVLIWGLVYRVAYQRTPYNMLAVTYVLKAPWKYPTDSCCFRFSCGLANVAGQRFVLSLHGMSQQTIAQEYMTSRLPQFSRMRLPNGTISNLDGPCNTVLTSIQEEEASQIVGSPSELPRIATASGWWKWWIISRPR